MEKTVKVTIDINIARKALNLAGFWKIAESGTDDEVFQRVLNMMKSYGAKTEIVEDAISPDAVSLLTAMAVLAEYEDPRMIDGSAGFVGMLPCDECEDCINDSVAF